MVVVAEIPRLAGDDGAVAAGTDRLAGLAESGVLGARSAGRSTPIG
jgi:hypothetical protein